MRSLFSKLLIAQLLLLAIAFGVLAFLLHLMVYPSYEKMMGDQLLERGQALAARIAPYLEKQDWPAINQRLELVKASLGAEVCLVNTQRKVLAHATPENAAQWSDKPPITSCCPDFSFTGPSVGRRGAVHTACNQDMLVAAVPVFLPGPVDQPAETAAGWLLLRQPLEGIKTVAGKLWQLIALCGLLGAGSALALSLALTARISGPLRSMRGMAAAMAKGDFAARLKVKSRDEVGQLAESFNAMAERLRDSRASREDESAKLRGVLGSMAEGVLAINAQERILLANPQTFGILNLPQRELVGQPVGEAGLPERLVSAFRQCLADRKLVNEELNAAAPWQWQSAEAAPEASVAAVHIVPMHLGQEEWGAVGVILDVSEAHRLEGMRRRFFSDISHELRTPLTNITGYASALEDGVAADPASQAQAISVILKESDRLRRFIEDLLDLSRLESGEPGLQKEWCELAPLAQSAAECLAATAAQSQIGLHVEMPRDLPQVFVDPDRISQVFVNLVANAIHFNRPGGEVMICAAASPTEMTVMVKDTGLGIPADELPFVWDRFHRAAPATQPGETKSSRGELRTNGSGLGLAIVRSIVLAHGGRVWAESTVGQGSTFGFALPLG